MFSRFVVAVLAACCLLCPSWAQQTLNHEPTKTSPGVYLNYRDNNDRCSPGTYSGNGKKPCTDCPAGKYSKEPLQKPHAILEHILRLPVPPPAIVALLVTNVQATISHCRRNALLGGTLPEGLRSVVYVLLVLSITYKEPQGAVTVQQVGLTTSPEIQTVRCALTNTHILIPELEAGMAAQQSQGNGQFPQLAPRKVTEPAVGLVGLNSREMALTTVSIIKLDLHPSM
ncbi:hypothetical protein D9613_000658 [Agrocybe pediades]|uniref:Uncharacterized protein n=1 Tax=Agrocybe pediades TaxID=84607 RepID=A0A8H4R1P9_9AGAR|nr:hypothetical protein D9613_000658 [Agrocybe pediades]